MSLPPRNRHNRPAMELTHCFRSTWQQRERQQPERSCHLNGRFLETATGSKWPKPVYH